MAVIDLIKRTLRDGTDVEIRSLDGFDAGVFIRFMKQALATSRYLNKYPHEYALSTWKQRAILRSRMAMPTSFYVGLFHKDEMIAVLTAKGDPRLRHQHKVELGIAVKDGWRGRGVGYLLIDFFIDWCETMPQIRKIELNVNADNSGAIKLYHTFGFIEEGRRHMAIHMDDGTFADDIIMGLIVNSKTNTSRIRAEQQ